jgi:hypothetical protein
VLIIEKERVEVRFTIGGEDLIKSVVVVVDILVVVVVVVIVVDDDVDC